MGGWVVFWGNDSDFETRLKKFEAKFSVEGVPALRTESYSMIAKGNAICWAWNKDSVPDVFVHQDKSFFLLLCGIITDMGRFGTSFSAQRDIAKHILELLIKHGEQVIPELNGSFSSFFYNHKEREISLFTDRFASRSVWIGEEEGTYIISNFPSAIAIMMQNPPKIDPAALWSLFHLGRHLGSHSLYSNIRALLAGQKATIRDDRALRISRWWQRRYEPESGLIPREWGSRLSQALLRSAERYKKVSKAPHLFLSGGLDSRIVAAAFKRPLETLTLCTSPNIESRTASLVSKVLGLEHTTIVRSPYWYLDTQEAASLISSGNFFNHHTHFIVPTANTVLDNPQAEFFLGDLLENFNKHYFLRPDRGQLIYDPENIENVLLTYVPYTITDRNRIDVHLNRDLRKSIRGRYTDALREYARSIVAVSEDHADRFNTFLRWADVSVTPTYNMITCLWPFAKERNLVFDNELCELSLKIPASLRGSGILHNWILYFLRKTLTLIPDANTFLPPLTPHVVINLSKKIRPIIGNLRRGSTGTGSNIPVLKTSGSWLLLHEMYRKDVKYRHMIAHLIQNNSVFPPEIFDLKQIQKTWKEYLAGNISLHFEIEAIISFGSLQRIIPTNGIQM